MGLVITLIIVGLLLLFIEILLVPGVGFAGILGFLSLAGSCFYAFNQMGTTAGTIVFSINLALVVLLSIYVLRAKTWKRLSLETNIDSKAVDPEQKLAVGDRGVTSSRLAPAGTARFQKVTHEVKALEGMIEPNVEVEVVLVEDGKAYVKPVGEEY